jgi:hypothetical protein
VNPSFWGSKMDLTALSEAFEDSIEARRKFQQQEKRAQKILEAMRRIFTCSSIWRYEIMVPVELDCTHQDHTQHALTLNGLEIVHKHKDGSWDCGEDSVDAVSLLKLISEKASELIHAAKMFQSKESAKTKEVKDFLDTVENALSPIIIAEKLKS